MSVQPSGSPRPVNATEVHSNIASYWLPHVPPPWIMLSTAFISAICYWAVITWASSLPWLGVTLASGEGYIQVTSVLAQGPAAGRLFPGDRLVALRTASGETISIAGDSLLEDPDFYPTYAEFNRFFQHQRELYAALTSGSVTFVLADGREVAVTPAMERPLSQLPWAFWIMSGFSVLVLQVGCGIWGFRRGQAATRLVALSSVGYMISGLTIATYTAREWVMEPNLFWWLDEFNHLGYMVYGYSALVLLWYYPRPLGRFPMAPLFLLAMALVWLNEVLQVVEWPLHTFFLQYFFPFTFGVWFSRCQWVRSRGRPDERAALLWFVLSVLISIGFVMLLYFLPHLFGAAPAIPFWVGHFAILGLYVGLVLGVLRYRLFDLERWWFVAWTWFLGGLLIVLVDVGLIYQANLHPVGALTLSIIIVAWIYFPIRQWLWSRFVRSPTQRLENHLPLLLETFLSAASTRDFQGRWQRLLRHLFDPLDSSIILGALEKVRLERDGLMLVVPDMGGERGIRLYGRSRGNRLFTPDDVQLASFILTLARKSAGMHAARERGAAVERERIARDLHDDVASHLLTLVHRAETPENAERVRTALQTLRESIYALSELREVSLESALADWRAEIADLVEAAGVRLEWLQPEGIHDISLSPSQRLNLVRVLREGVTNALRHAAPASMNIAITVTEQRLSLTLAHGGRIAPLTQWRTGKGLANMRTRVMELDGEIEWRMTPSETPEDPVRLEVSWHIPVLLSSSSNSSQHSSTP